MNPSMHHLPFSLNIENSYNTPELQFVVLSSFHSSSSFSDYSFLPDAKLELICQLRNVCSISPAISWTHNGLKLNTEYNWIQGDSTTASNYYCCIMNGSETLTTCVTITHKG